MKNGQRNNANHNHKKTNVFIILSEKWVVLGTSNDFSNDRMIKLPGLYNLNSWTLEDIVSNYTC